jgi:phospholipid/cholesterol/gamma-HCH transport system substrate-binding protein
MGKNMLETLTGAFVLIIATWFLLFFMQHNTGISVASNQYSLFAKFEQADGVSSGTPVRIAGVKVGVITAERVDPNTYFAIVDFSIDNKIKIPADSTAKISSEGLIGGKYLAIMPGGDDNMLKSGEEVKYTQSSINLETLIGKMMFSKSDSSSKDGSSDAKTTK